MAAATRFGQLLREARQLRGVNAEQIAVETGIPLGHVEALEAGQLNAIPGGMYRRAEARAYAEAVGLDPTLVLGALLNAVESPPALAARATDPLADGATVLPLAPVARARKEPPRRQWGVVAALLLGGATLLFEQTNSTPALPGVLSTPTPEAVPFGAAAVAQTIIEPIIEEIDEPISAAALGSLAASPSTRPAMAPRTPGAGATTGGPAAQLRDRELPRRAGRAATALVVNSTPRGARVTVNGIGWGTTPVTIRHLPAGVQRVRVVKEQFVSEERVVELTSGQSRRVAIPLRPVRRTRR